MSESYSTPPKPNYTYPDVPPKARLTPCPHRFLFGIPNGMTKEQLEDHSRRCVVIEGNPYRVYLIHEETDQ